MKAWRMQVRTVFLDLQKCMCHKMKTGNNIASCLVDFSAVSINTLKMDEAARTAFYRDTGGSHGRPVAAFGERVWRIPNGSRDPSMKA